jgi:hypothetical protein
VDQLRSPVLSDDTRLGLAPVDRLIRCLSFRHLVEQSLARNLGSVFVETFALLVRAAWCSLRPGGHPLELLQALDKVCFVAVNIFLARGKFFVGDGRKPPALAAALASTLVFNFTILLLHGVDRREVVMDVQSSQQNRCCWLQDALRSW